MNNTNDSLNNEEMNVDEVSELNLSEDSLSTVSGGDFRDVMGFVGDVILDSADIISTPFGLASQAVSALEEQMKVKSGQKSESQAKRDFAVSCQPMSRTKKRVKGK